MIALARAELLKLRSTRTALGMVIAAALVTVLPAVLLMRFCPRARSAATMPAPSSPRAAAS